MKNARSNSRHNGAYRGSNSAKRIKELNTPFDARPLPLSKVKNASERSKAFLELFNS